MRKNDDERQAAIAVLREWMKPGDTVFTVLRHVSRSGMQREIGVVLVRPESHSHFPADSTVTVRHPEYQIGKALGIRMGKREGLIVGGCGMDMGFHLVYELSATLWPDGYPCVGANCPSNDHTNGDRNYAPHLHRDGGYALAQRWL